MPRQAPSDVEIDNFALRPLDGDGFRADDIPRDYSPSSCRWEAFLQSVLAECREPLVPDAGVASRHVDSRDVLRGV